MAGASIKRSLRFYVLGRPPGLLSLNPPQYVALHLLRLRLVAGGEQILGNVVARGDRVGVRRAERALAQRARLLVQLAGARVVLALLLEQSERVERAGEAEARVVGGGRALEVGVGVGVDVGWEVGVEVGVGVGMGLGWCVGAELGLGVGRDVGWVVGVGVGARL